MASSRTHSSARKGKSSTGMSAEEDADFLSSTPVAILACTMGSLPSEEAATASVSGVPASSALLLLITPAMAPAAAWK